jgi:hypothetical protein
MIARVLVIGALILAVLAFFSVTLGTVTPLKELCLAVGLLSVAVLL